MNNQITILDANDSGDNLSREAHATAVEPGHYWHCREDAEGIRVKWEDKTFNFRAGRMYLLTRLEYFDGKLHSVVLLDDPSNSTESGLLTLDLLFGRFEPVDDRAAKAFRDKQIAEIQAEAADIQHEMMEAQTNPALMQEAITKGLKEWERELARERRRPEDDDAEPAKPQANLPAVSTNGRFDLTAAIDSKISSTDIEVFRHMAQREGKIAEIRGKWLTKKVEQLGSTLKQLTPFFSEHAAVGLARAHDALTLSKDVEKGLRSLRLYTGEGVEVVTLLTGESAPASEPLTLYQRKLFMDEEFAVWDDVERMFDYLKADKFFDAMAKNEALRNQLIPAQRGVVSMAVRRTDVKYAVDSNGAAAAAEAANRANKALFLLVRDGGNWYQVFSDEPSHEMASRLFPTRNEMDQIFKGFDGEKIGFEDLRFTNRTNEFDRKSLAYKRFLILACGLDHSKKLFGQFYPEQEAMSFISMGFQANYMRFIADDDSDVMLGDNVGSVHALIEHNHGQLAAGCRVLVFGKEALQQEAAPGAFNKGRETRNGGKHYSLIARPTEKAHLLTVCRDKGDLVVYLPVRRINETTFRGRWEGYQPVERPEFNVRVALNKLSGDGLGYLITDTLKAEELRPYIYSRRTRASHWDYLYGFKLAMKMLAVEEAVNSRTMDQLREAATVKFGLAKQAAEIAAVSAAQSWRLKNATVETLPARESAAFDALEFELAEVAYAFTHAVPAVQAAIEKLGGKVIRIMRGKKGVLVAYYEQPDAERDLRIHEWLWAGRRTFTPAGKPTKDAPETIWLRRGRIVGETELVAYPSNFEHTFNIRGNREKLTAFLDKADEMADILSDAFKGERLGVSDRAWLALTALNPDRPRHMDPFDRNREVLLPVAVCTQSGVVLGIAFKGYDLLYFYGSDAQRAALTNQGYALPKPVKDIDGNVVPYEGVRVFLYVDKYCYPSHYVGPVNVEAHTTFPDYPVWPYGYKGERRLDNAMRGVMAYVKPEKPAKREVYDRSEYLDPKTLWIPRRYWDENGEVSLSRFFPDLATA